MTASTAIADSPLRRAFGGQARRSLPRRTVQVRLGISRLRMPVSQRDCTISRRTIMNNAGSSEIQLSTPEGFERFDVDALAGSKLSVFQEGVPVTVELDADNVMIDIQRSR